MQLIAGDASRHPVTRHRHPGQHDPAVGRRIVAFEGPKRRALLGILHLAAGHVDAPAVNAAGDRAARRRHAGLDPPKIIGWIVLLDHVGIAGEPDEGGSQSTPDGINLSIDRAGHQMVACGRHRPALAPGVGGDIVFLDRADGEMRTRRQDRGFIGSGRGGGAAHHIDFAVDHGRRRRAALGRHGRQRLPVVRRRIVFPGIVDRDPGGRPRQRWNEAAERIDLALVFGEGDMVGWQRHLFPLGPFVRGGVVFVNQGLGFPDRRQAREDIHLAAGRHAQNLLGRVGKRRFAFPFPLRKSIGRDGQRAQQADERHPQQRPRRKHLFLPVRRSPESSMAAA